MRDETLDEDLLPGPDVRPDPDAQLRIALEPLFHQRDPTPRRGAGHRLATEGLPVE
jgi:hypothetical protein